MDCYFKGVSSSKAYESVREVLQVLNLDQFSEFDKIKGSFSVRVPSEAVLGQVATAVEDLQKEFKFQIEPLKESDYVHIQSHTYKLEQPANI